MLTTSILAGSSPFLLASAGSSFSAAPPAGEPSFLPATSAMVYMIYSKAPFALLAKASSPIKTIASSANGALL